ncbi:MAG: hypothetical protein ABI550_05935 [Ignavibacteriaceae bacterium]
MKRSILLLGFVVLFLFFFSNSCTESTNPVDGGGGDFVPLLDNVWRDTLDANHTFQLQQIEQNVTHGFFKGKEDNPDSNIFNANIIGVFTNQDIEFNSERPAGPVKFIGTILSDTTMDITYYGRKISLKKG